MLDGINLPNCLDQATIDQETDLRQLHGKRDNIYYYVANLESSEAFVLTNLTEI